MKIFITMPNNDVAATFFTPRAMEALNALGEVTQNPLDHNLTVEEVLELGGDADVLVAGWGTCRYSKADLEKFPNLKIIAYTAGSVAPVVTADAYETGVLVLGGNDCFAKSVAEGALCYTLAALRRMEHYMAVMREGGWKERVFSNRGLFGKRVGIVGFGAIAKHFVNMIRWYDLEVLIYSSHLSNEEAAQYGARTASLEEIFSSCDVISIHASAIPKNKGLVTRELMAMMQPDALLVNTARSMVVDEPAMIEMLLEGKFYAALDVYDKEPPLPDAPLRKCKNALLMPHQGGPTIDMREVIILELCKDIKRWEKGEPVQYEIPLEVAVRMTGFK